MFHVKHIGDANRLKEIAHHQFGLFKQGTNLLGIPLQPEQEGQFEHYINLLVEWNQKINLFSRHDTNRLAERHLLESIAWLPSVGAPRPPIMDLGSGAGFPGIPVSILHPESQVVLVESKRKKALFLQHVVDELHLNARVIRERAEEMASHPAFRRRFQTIISRAVADLNTLVTWAMPLLTETGDLFSFKGDSLDRELQEFHNSGKKHLKFTLEVIDYHLMVTTGGIPEKVNRKLVKVGRMAKNGEKNFHES